MNVIFTSGSVLAGAFYSSMNNFGAISDYIAIVASDKKYLLVAQIFDQNAIDRVGLPRGDAQAAMASFRRMKDKIRVGTQILVRKSRPVYVYIPS